MVQENEIKNHHRHQQYRNAKKNKFTFRKIIYVYMFISETPRKSIKICKIKKENRFAGYY